jgi:hypothetical protein
MYLGTGSFDEMDKMYEICEKEGFDVMNEIYLRTSSFDEMNEMYLRMKQFDQMDEMRQN